MHRTNNDILDVYTADGKVPEPVLDLYAGENVPAVFTISRETYEKSLRFMVRKIPNIVWLSGTVVDVCCTEGDYSDVKAVKIRTTGTNDKTREGALPEVYLPAALVIGISVIGSLNGQLIGIDRQIAPVALELVTSG
jgi:hypothetical protein